MKKVMQIFIAAIYILGAILTLVLLAIFIVRPNIILYPDSMLPTLISEEASLWLAAGAIPMWAASLLFCKALPVFHGRHRIRNRILALVPAVICTCFAVFWVVVLAVGMVNSFSKLGEY